VAAVDRGLHAHADLLIAQQGIKKQQLPPLKLFDRHWTA
jgi:hypothetical protein